MGDDLSYFIEESSGESKAVGLNCSVVQINELFRCRLFKKTFDTNTKLENHSIKVI